MMPATLSSASMRGPNFSLHAATTPAGASPAVRSTWWAWKPPGALEAAACSSSDVTAAQSTANTFACDSSSSNAVASPIPDAAPVTMTTLPPKSKVEGMAKGWGQVSAWL